MTATVWDGRLTGREAVGELELAVSARSRLLLPYQLVEPQPAEPMNPRNLGHKAFVAVTDGGECSGRLTASERGCMHCLCVVSSRNFLLVTSV